MAPVAEPVKFGVGFRGYIRLPGGPYCRVEALKDSVRITGTELQFTGYGAELAPDGPGRFRLTGDGNFYGTVRREGGKTVLTLDRPTPKLATTRWRFMSWVLEPDQHKP
jgi:hypothetical protein